MTIVSSSDLAGEHDGASSPEIPLAELVSVAYKHLVAHDASKERAPSPEVSKVLQRPCSIAACNRLCPPGWTFKMCERCQTARRKSNERRRLRKIQEQALDRGGEAVSCAICTRHIPSPAGSSGMRQEQFVLCWSCQSKMIRANSQPSHLPPSRLSSTPQPGAPAAHAADKGHPSSTWDVPHQMNPRTTCSALDNPPAGASPPREALVSRWSWSKTLEQFRDMPHLDEKGEYINPQFVPVCPSRPSAAPREQTFPALNASASQLHYVEGSVPISPSYVNDPTQARPRKPLDLRIPPSTSRRSDARSLGSVMSPVSTVTSAPQYPSGVRLCVKLDCNAVLSPRHPYIFCNRCLNVPARSSAADDEGSRKKRKNRDLTDANTAGPGMRRASEPSLRPTETRIPAEGKRRASGTVVPSPDEGAEAKTAASPYSSSHPPVTALGSMSPLTPLTESFPSTPDALPERPSTGSTSASDRPHKQHIDDTNAFSILTPPPSAKWNSPVHLGNDVAMTHYSLMQSQEPVTVRIPPRTGSPLPTPVSAGFQRIVIPAHEKYGSQSVSAPADMKPLNDSELDSSESEEDALEIIRRKYASALAVSQATAGVHPHNWTCRQTRCQNLIYPTSKWKTCQPCRQRYRKYVHGRSDREPKWKKQDLYDDEGLASDSEIVLTAEGHRKCTIRSCHNVIPPVREYRWKMCEDCRTRTRRNARKRKNGSPYASDHEADAGENASGTGTLPVKFKKMKLLFQGKQVASLETPLAPARNRSPLLLRRPSIVNAENRFPTFQTFDVLVATFRTRFIGFITAHTQYLKFKLSSSTARPIQIVGMAPVAFIFNGEFSVVADPAGGEVATRIQLVRGAVSEALGTSFGVHPPSYRVELDGKVVGLFSCIHEVLVPLPRMHRDSPEAVEKGGASLNGGDPAKKSDPTIESDTAEDSHYAKEGDPVKEGNSTREEVTALGGDAAKQKGAAKTDRRTEEGNTEDVSPHQRAENEHAKSFEIHKPGGDIPQTIDDTGEKKQVHRTALPNVAVKRMTGELEVSVMWDRSHPYIPGLRTLIRFKLMG